LVVPTEECAPGSGIWFEATAPDGAVYGSCVTELSPNGLSGLCSIVVPYDTTVIVTEDIDTIPAGYAPRENPISVEIPPPPLDGPINGAVFVNLPTTGEQSSDDEDATGDASELPTSLPQTGVGLSRNGVSTELDLLTFAILVVGALGLGSRRRMER
jgi:hypothetical protein